MASSKPARKPTAPPARQPVRKAITLELVRHIAPHSGTALAIGSKFGLEVPDCEAIADATEEQIGHHAEALKATLSEKAMELHLQRLVGAFVGSAHGAARFYSEKVTQARDLTSRLANDARDEDREPAYGFESKAQGAREFAARMGLQAYALLAAAEGAASAYAAIIGEEWKPWQRDQPASAGIARHSGEEEMSAFD